MTDGDRWTTEDIAQGLGLTRANARQKIRRWRKAGIRFDVEIDELTGTKRYLPGQIREAHDASPGRGYRSDIARKQAEQQNDN